MKTARMLVFLAVTFVASGQGLASAYQDIGYDPADRDHDYPDVLSTTRRVWTHNDDRFVRVSFTSEERVDFDTAYWSMRVRLDTRGDQEFDVVMKFWDLEMDGSGCTARTGDGTGKRVEGRLHLGSHAASCRVRADQFRLGKRVRWRLMSPTFHTPGEVEYAPNHGYYR